MNDAHDPTATLPTPPPPPLAEPAPPAEPKVRRTLGLPVVGAVAAAALLIGGLAGGIIGYAVHSDSDGGRPDFGTRQGGPGQQFQQGGPGNGQQPQPPSNG
ncbi:hypothetical protein ASC77_10525 [Nocardioides sp. Root1257]|uniref:hypothetical protein n=1 Tax=unclassified Nocardioides TaxID=2615069 RepID=UPI000701F2D4|nr:MULTISPECIES: hypothetical protein [unclassified Nocardioides]KQW49122.1 hypothetical protein ASC77_10525 [Nocardioides sp. Root1257]KRC48296.1 hypothetical protein ASE24_10530 [Nocardioides sp. Root224]